MPESDRGLSGRMTGNMLEIKNLTVGYGAISALHGISLSVKTGSIVTLIGSNGAGKTTTLKSISGLLVPKSGEILYAGKNISGLPPHLIVRRGLSHVPEGRMIFANLTVLENLQMGAALSDAAHFSADIARVLALFPRLEERLDQRGGTLSGGEQQMLAIARALMSRPRLLLLDEPSLGLAPLVARQIFDAIRALNAEEKITVFLVEQNAFHALKLAHRGYVMVNGRIALAGSGRELLARPEVQAAYLEGGRH